MKFDNFALQIAELCESDWAHGCCHSAPEREQYLAGFKDCCERDGKGPTPPEELAASAAYNSGWIAAREEFNL